MLTALQTAAAAAGYFLQVEKASKLLVQDAEVEDTEVGTAARIFWFGYSK